MKTITFITGNSYKFQVAKQATADLNIELIQQKLETPEIQSTDVREVAMYSAAWASAKLNRPVVVTDAGYYISALNGFPGPFIKYINQWLTPLDILKLMTGESNREVEVIMCMAYCEPGKEAVPFMGSAKGTIAFQEGKSNIGYVTTINTVFIPEGFNRVESEIPRDEMVLFWAKAESYWKDLASYIQS